MRRVFFDVGEATPCFYFAFAVISSRLRFLILFFPKVSELIYVFLTEIFVGDEMTEAEFIEVWSKLSVVKAVPILEGKRI